MPRAGVSADESVLRVPKLSSFFKSAMRRSSDTDFTSVTIRESRSDGSMVRARLKPDTTYGEIATDMIANIATKAIAVTTAYVVSASRRT